MCGLRTGGGSGGEDACRVMRSSDGKAINKQMIMSRPGGAVDIITGFPPVIFYSWFQIYPAPLLWQSSGFGISILPYLMAQV